MKLLLVQGANMAAVGVIAGLGVDSYLLALEAMVARLSRAVSPA